MNLLMQGISFMELGQEFGRTKLVPTGENGELTHDDRERCYEQLQCSRRC